MISQRLKALRDAGHLSQQYVADRLNMSRSAYSAYETGKHEPSLETLSLLADIFRTTTDYLLGRRDYPGPVPELDDQSSDVLRCLSVLDPHSRKIVHDVALQESLRYAENTSTSP